MASTTRTLGGLNSLLEELSLERVPNCASTQALIKPVDIWRSYFASFLSNSSLLDCEAAAIWEAISSTTDTSLGDLMLILPRLKLKDVDKDGLKKLAFDLGTQVWQIRLPGTPLIQSSLHILVSYIVSVPSSLGRWYLPSNVLFP